MENAGQANSQGQQAAESGTGAGVNVQDNAMPSLDEIISGMNGQQNQQAAQEPPQEAKPEKKPELSEFERIQKQENELFKMKKQFADERKEFERKMEEFNKQKSDFDNYLNNFGEEPEAEQEHEELTYDELRAKIEKEVFDKLEAQKTEERERQEEEMAINNFKQDINKLLTDRASDFPLASAEGMGGEDLIYQTIEAQFDQDVSDYGFERAEKMIMSTEQAAQKVEKYIAQQMQTMLKSDQVRAFLQKELGFQAAEGRKLNDPQQLRDEPNTLTNDSFMQSSHGQRDIDSMGDDEALEYAMGFISKPTA